MDCHDALIMTVNENGGEFHSRTAIQKLCYFYTKKISGFGPKYVPHFYGPFSDKVASALTELSEFSFVNEIAYSGFYGGYTYELTKMGRQYAEKASGELPSEREQIGDILEICKKHCGLKPAPLSYAAKCHYILSEDGRECTSADIKKAGRDLHWDITDDDISGGISLLQGLGLVK